MASSKRRPSKSKRYRQNKAERDARRARSAHAGEATAISRGELDPPVTESSGRARRAGRESAPTEGADTAGTGKSTGRGRAGRRQAYTIPGQRAVVLAFLFTIVSAITLIVSPVGVRRDVPKDDPRVEASDTVNDDGTVQITDEIKLLDEESAPVAGLILLTPIAIAGGALYFTKRPQRTLAWTIAMVAMAGFTFVAAPYSTFSIVALLALAVAGFQSRRAESKVRIAELKQQRAARKAAKNGEIIDVDATEELSERGRRD